MQIVRSLYEDVRTKGGGRGGGGASRKEQLHNEGRVVRERRERN